MLSPKIQKWLDQSYIPQRLLLSGSKSFENATEIASHLSQEPKEKILSGIISDILVLRDNGESFRIGENQNPEKNTARGIISWISQKPIGNHRIIILENFERASREAPQTLLKILEEPPQKAIFLFTTKNHHQILPTILSRMTVVAIHTDTTENLDTTVAKNFLDTQSWHEKIRIIDTLDQESKDKKTKKAIFDFLESLLAHIRTNIQWLKYGELIFEAQTNIKNNINPRLALENLALQIKNQ